MLKSLTKEEKLERFIKMGWEILEHKCRYYIMCTSIIEDHVYDKLEKEYEALAAELGLEPSASNMIDFDTKRPSSRLVMDKLGCLYAETGLRNPNDY